MTSHTGSPATPGSGSPGAVRRAGVVIFMSAILTYFGLFVTQCRALAKGSCSRTTPAATVCARVMCMFSWTGQTYRELRPDAKASVKPKGVRPQGDCDDGALRPTRRRDLVRRQAGA